MDTPTDTPWRKPGASSPREFPCKSCGGKLNFAPGQDALQCPFCGVLNEIAADQSQVQELDYLAALRELESHEETEDRIVVHCNACGADVPMRPNVTSQNCDFCGSPIVATAQTRKLLRPKSLLPFFITDRQARETFVKWLGGRWFAPSDLKKLAAVDGRLAGFYLPYFTYDCNATTDYTGQRGDDYWTTETYTVVVNGRTQTRTRAVKRTRWRFASGRVFDRFNDVLIPASTSLPVDRLNQISRWDLDQLVSYDDRFLAGFKSESYTVTLPNGFENAKAVMAERIKLTIRADIGGDHQIISSMHSVYDAITFKHILLPIWIAAYRYRGKTYRFIVNARSGDVTGDRPYSWVKITLFVLMCLLVIGVLILVGVMHSNR